jgi:aminopeptidase C
MTTDGHSVLYVDPDGVVVGVAGTGLWSVVTSHLSVDGLDTHAALGNRFVVADDRDWKVGDQTQYVAPAVWRHLYRPQLVKEDAPVDRTIEQLIEEGRACSRKNIARFAERLEREAVVLRDKLDAHDDFMTAEALKAEALQRIHRTRKGSTAS